MNLFKSFTLTWWQTGLFKIGMLALGILIGATWSSFFSAHVMALIIVAALTLGLVLVVWLGQVTRRDPPATRTI
jgi:hypothetical protein